MLAHTKCLSTRQPPRLKHRSTRCFGSRETPSLVLRGVLSGLREGRRDTLAELLPRVGFRWVHTCPDAPHSPNLHPTLLPSWGRRGSVDAGQEQEESFITSVFDSYAIRTLLLSPPLKVEVG